MQEKLLLGLVVLFVLFLKRKAKKVLESPMIAPIDQAKPFGKFENLRPYIEAQARHETGNFKSPLALDYKNIFGMKRPTQRPFLGIGASKSGYAVYDSWSQSTDDFLAYLDYVKFPENVTGSFEYVNELKKRKYFEDNTANYLNGVNSALFRLKKEGYNNFKITY